MKATKRLAVLAGALMLSASLFAYTANSWKADSSGSWNGRYSDVNHWSLGHLPKVDEDAVFENRSGVEFTVEIDCDVTVGDGVGPEFFKVGNSGYTPTEMAAPVRFIGSGTVTSESRSFFIYSYRYAIFDGDVKFVYGVGAETYTNRKFELCGNASLSFGGTFYFGGTNEIVIAGGELSAATLSIGPGTKYLQSDGTVSASDGINFSVDTAFTMTGGTCSGKMAFNATSEVRLLGGTLVGLGAASGVATAAVFEIDGGRFVHKDAGTITTPRIMPKNGGIYDYTGSGAYCLQYSSSLTNELSGSLFETNMAAEAWIRLEGPQNLLYGGGRISTDTIYLPVSSGRTVLDLSRIDFKTRIYSSAGHELVFPRDVTIGSFGNWVFHSVNLLPITFENSATFDTRNFVNGNTHTFAIHDYIPVFGNAFCATGGGTVTLYSNARQAWTIIDQPFYRALTVGANTTLNLDAAIGAEGRCGRDAVIRFGDGRLEAGSTLNTTKMKTVSPEFAGRLDAGEGAKIVTSADGVTFSDDSGNMSGGGLCWAVISASGGEGVPLANVTVTDMPEGATLEKVGPVVYLVKRSAQTSVHVAPTTWTGAVDGDWSKPGNWLGNAVPTSTEPVYFSMCAGSREVTVPEAGVTVANLWGGGVDATSKTWIRNAEPFVFKGGKITVTSKTTQSYAAGIADCGKMPKIFECPVEGPDGNLGVNVHNFMSFNGGLTARSLCGSGDIRIGGTATCGDWNPMPKYTQARATSLTVFNGGHATFTAQATSIAQLSAFHVFGGSTLTFQGTKGLRYVNAPENRNIIDGTLEASVFAADTDQTFVGTGRVDVVSVIAGAAAGRLTLKGGIRFDMGSVAAGAISFALADYQFATLGATGDWTLPAVDLGYRADLTLDTGDAHTITVGDQDLGDGYVTVAGTGTAKLASPLRVRRFTLANGAHLAIDRALPGKDWGAVLTATEELALEEDAIVAGDGCKVRLVRNADGSMSVQAREKPGMMLMVR